MENKMVCVGHVHRLYIKVFQREDCWASCLGCHSSKTLSSCHTHWYTRTNTNTKCNHTQCKNTNQAAEWQLHCQQMDRFHQSYWLRRCGKRSVSGSVRCRRLRKVTCVCAGKRRVTTKALLNTNNTLFIERIQQSWCISAFFITYTVIAEFSGC